MRTKHEQLQGPSHRRQFLPDQFLFPHAHRHDLHPGRGRQHLRGLLLSVLPVLHRGQGLLRHGAGGPQLLQHRPASAVRPQAGGHQLHARGPRLSQQDRRAGLARRHPRREDEELRLHARGRAVHRGRPFHAAPEGGRRGLSGLRVHLGERTGERRRGHRPQARGRLLSAPPTKTSTASPASTARTSSCASTRF